MKHKLILISTIIALACLSYWTVQNTIEIRSDINTVPCTTCHEGEVMNYKEDILKEFEELKNYADSLPTKQERDKAHKIVAETMRDTSKGKMRMHIFQRDNINTGEIK